MTVLAAFVLLTLLLGLVRVVRGPARSTGCW